MAEHLYSTGDRLRKLCIEIGQDMRSEEFETIKYRIGVPAAEAERMTKPVALWPYLEKKDLIDYDDEERTLNYLQSILDASHFKGERRLSNHVRRFLGESVERERADVKRPEIDPALNRAFEYLSHNLIKDWKMFFRHGLAMDHSFCEGLAYEYRHEKHSDMIYKGLRHWLEYNPRKTIEDILNALADCQLNLHQDEIKFRLSNNKPLSAVE